MCEELKNIVLQGFTDQHIVVIGDLMLDKYLMGSVRRVSPEAPVPVMRLREEKLMLGGSGNVALNLKRLGVSVSLIGLVGTDSNSSIIKGLLEEQQISSDHLISSSAKPTITKTRIVGERQQIARIDQEEPSPVNSDIQSLLIEKVDSLIASNSIDAIIISDYAKGLITDEGCRSIIRTAKEESIPVIIDPKGKDFTKYENATVLMPNEAELSIASRGNWQTEEGFTKIATQMYKALHVDYLAVTRGPKGISLIIENKNRDIPTTVREVYDVSGAGDTAAAVLTIGFVAGLPIDKAIELANIAAGYVVSRWGTYAVSHAELSNVIQRYGQEDTKRFSLPELKTRVAEWKNHNQTVVFTNGCFDILHRGHIHLLREAKKEGDKLIVALNTDESVQQLKGKSRPLNTLKDRISVLEALSVVDAIIVFEEQTPLRLIKQIRPDVLVKGADYREEEIVGARVVKTGGGKVVRIPLVEGKSTTGLIKQISKNHTND